MAAVQLPPNDSSGGQFGLIYGSSDTIHVSTRFGHLESLDQGTLESPELLQKRSEELLEREKSTCGSSRKKLDYLLSIVCIFVIGLCSAGVGIGVHSSIFSLLRIKNENTASLMYTGMWLNAFFSHISFTLFFTLIAFLAVWCELTAVGSGIPEVKSLLNGINLTTAFRMRTLLAKLVSVVFAVSSGLFVGPDGPMIHISAIIGLVMSRLYTYLKLDSNLLQNVSLRDFATFGTAAAVAASFRAPFGGILFAIEEAASNWSAQLVTKAFICASVAYLLVVVVDKIRVQSTANSEEISSNFSFGHFSQSYAGHMDYRILELVLFVIVGAFGGVMGSIFVIGNNLFGKMRRKFIGKSLGNRFAEIMIVSMFTAWLTFTLPIIWSTCTAVPDSADTYLSNDERMLVSQLVQYNCPHGSYNQAASLLFVDSNVAVKMMFHLREHMAAQTFSVDTLLVVYVPYFLFSMYTIGLTASVGAFIPLLISGALMGRIIGAGFVALFPDTVADSGTYALVGAAAMLGGACRSVAAITVILIETTGNVQFALPLMISLVSARLVGDTLSPGLYVSICASRDYIYLPENIDAINITESSLTEGFMTKKIVTLSKVSSISRIINVLKVTTHNYFPVVSSSKVLQGVVSRPGLVKILMENSKNGRILQTDVEIRLEGRVDADYDRRLIEAIDAVIIDGVQEISLDNIMDISPYTVFRSASIQRAYKMFTSLGLRHLIVINETMKVVGMLTRSDFRRHSSMGVQEFTTSNPIIQATSRLSPYKRVDDQDVEEGNFVMNPYVSKHSSKAKSKLSVSDATMYPAAEISTYKSKSKNRGTSGLKM